MTMRNENLKHISETELRKELAFRESERAKTPIPEHQVEYDWSKVVNLATSVRDTLAEGEYVDEDMPHYIYEEVMKAVFGEKYFEWHNKNIL